MQELLQKKIAEALGVAPANVAITIPEVSEFGHYSTSVAMRMAKETKKAPLELAQIFAATLQTADEGKMFAKIEAAKPGFINFWLSDSFLQEQFRNGDISQAPDNKQTVIVEYSSCNIAKPMHVGHLRSTVIGDALANIFTFLGYKVVRWNYLGDWGTQFGKLIAAYKLWGDKAKVEKDPINELVALYVRFHDELKSNPELENQGQLEFKKLAEGDKENKKLWEWFKDESLIVFHKMFKRLGVKFDEEIGEAFYEDAVYDVLKDLDAKGLLIPGEPAVADSAAVATLAKETAVAGEGGRAKIVNLDAFKLPPALIQKSDGASLYITRDIALLKHRLSRYKPTMILNEVGNEQTLHFQQLYAVAELLGLTSAKLMHIKHGLVLGEDGKKLSTREGKAVTFESIINQITERAFAVVSEKSPELSEQQRHAVAEAVGIGALKYNDLRENRNSDITFNWDQMLNFNGDSAPYLQYTVVRLNSILNKAFAQEPALAERDLNLNNVSELVLDSERNLMKKILDFGDVVKLCGETYYTSHLAKYLFELAKLGNQYYESVRILDDTNVQRRDGRFLLVVRTADAIKKGLGLLGITVPERI